MDLSLLHWINSWPESLSPFFVFLSEAIDMTGVRILLLAGVIFFALRRQTRKGTLLVFFTWPLADLATNVLKKAIPFPRPYNDNITAFEVIVRVGQSDSMGTASAHAANMAFVATVITFYFRAWGAPWILIAFLVGLSRIYVGAHYPSQVLFGWIVGVAVALGVCYLAEWISRRRKPKASEEPEAAPSGLHDPEYPAATPQP